MLSLIKANIDNLKRLNIKYSEREQAQLIPRKVELKDEPLRKKKFYMSVFFDLEYHTDE